MPETMNIEPKYDTDVRLGTDYESGRKAAAREILSYIEHICFSNDSEIIQFRVNRGRNGVRDNIIEFIRSTYLV